MVEQALGDRAGKLAHLRQLTLVMDSAIEVPGTRYRVGIDGIVGLIPGIGDVFGLVVSSYFILIAAQLGIPKSVVVRMFVNVAVDSAIGSIPLLGDLFDFGWKANTKNLRLLEQSVNDPRSAKKSSMVFLAGILIALVAAVALVVVTISWLVTLLISLIRSGF